MFGKISDFTDIPIERLGLLQELRKNCLSARPEICIERARYVTEYLRDLASLILPDEELRLHAIFNEALGR